MAFYVPQARRRRRFVLSATGAAVLGITVGAVGARTTAPSVDERVAHVQQAARDTAAGLRVISLHTSATTAGAGGTDLVLQRAQRDLTREFDQAPWISDEQRSIVLGGLARLQAVPDKAGPEFGRAVDDFAGTIEDVFRGRFVAPTNP